MSAALFRRHDGERLQQLFQQRSRPTAWLRDRLIRLVVVEIHSRQHNGVSKGRPRIGIQCGRPMKANEHPSVLVVPPHKTFLYGDFLRPRCLSVGRTIEAVTPARRRRRRHIHRYRSTIDRSLVAQRETMNDRHVIQVIAKGRGPCTVVGRRRADGYTACIKPFMKEEVVQSSSGVQAKDDSFLVFWVKHYKSWSCHPLQSGRHWLSFAGIGNAT